MGLPLALAQTRGVGRGPAKKKESDSGASRCVYTKFDYFEICTRFEYEPYCIQQPIS